MFIKKDNSISLDLRTKDRFYLRLKTLIEKVNIFRHVHDIPEVLEIVYEIEEIINQAYKQGRLDEANKMGAE